MAGTLCLNVFYDQVGISSSSVVLRSTRLSDSRARIAMEPTRNINP
jgi:hypothetical protein